MDGEISLGGLVGARSQDVPLGVKVALDPDRQCQSACDRPRPGLCPHCVRIDPELNLREPLTGGLAGILLIDLAHVAETLAALVAVESILDHPGLLACGSDPNAEARQTGIP